MFEGQMPSMKNIYQKKAISDLLVSCSILIALSPRESNKVNNMALRRIAVIKFESVNILLCGLHFQAPPLG